MQKISRKIIQDDFVECFDELIAISQILLTYDNDYIVNDIDVEPFKTLFYRQHELIDTYNQMNDDLNRNLRKEQSVINKRSKRRKWERTEKD